MPSSGISAGGGIPYPPVIITTSLPNATQNQLYTTQLSAINGFPPYSWSLVSGPPGLTVTSSGQISWTPTVAGLSTVTVTLNDSKLGLALPVSLSLNVIAVLAITSASPLPGATAGTPYSFTFAANGGLQPYTWIAVSGLPPWDTLSSAGVLSGTPTGAETDSIVVQVQDSSTPSKLVATKTFALTVTGTVSEAAPAAIWPGYADTQSVDFGFWGPATGTFDHINIYKNPNLALAPGPTNGLLYGTLQPRSVSTASVIPDGVMGNGGHPLAWFTDVGLAPGATNTYAGTCVDASGNESAFSPALTRSTLLNGSSAFPASIASPDGWIVPPPSSYNPAPGGTLWLCTDITNGDVPGTTTATGNFFTCTGCSVKHALANSNIAGGDTIVCTAGATYQVPVGAYNPPAYTGATGFTTIISSNELVYNPSASPALPAFTFSMTQVNRGHFTASAAILAGATSATLNAGWIFKSGYYFVTFSDGEERLVLFTNGSSAISWTTYNTGYTTPGLTNSVTVDLLVWFLNGVTPFDIPAMPTFSYGTAFQGCFNLAPGTQKVRFVGLNMPGARGVTGGPGQLPGAILGPNTTGPGPVVTPADSIYLDRCIIGDDVTAANYSYQVHGFNATINHFLMQGCYQWGIVSNIAGSGGDANSVVRGQFHCIQNCYMSAISEGIIWGGVYTAQSLISQDISVRNNLFHKPLMWFAMRQNGNANFNNVKNHLEIKCGQRAEINGNQFLNCWVDADAGYHGAALSINCRDQSISTASTDAGTNPWNIVSDIFIHDNQIDNCACALQTFSADGPTGFTTRVRLDNNRGWISTINPSAERMQSLRVGPGPVVDLIINNCTFIVNNTLPTTGVGAAYGVYFPIFGNASGSYLNPQPFTENPWSTYQDRMTISNSIIDSGVGSGQAFHYDPGLAGFAGQKNMVYGPNLTISDPSTTYPATTFPGVPYASVGFANFAGNTKTPFNPADWNVTTGQFATANASGGPIGYFSGTRPVTQTAKNWDPGWYCQIPLHTTATTTSAQRISSFYNPDLSAFPWLKGYCVRPFHKLVESVFNDLVLNPTTNAFVTNFLGDLNWAAQNNKKLVFKIEFYNNQDDSTGTSVFPSYFVTPSDPNYPGGTGGVPTFYHGTVSGTAVTRMFYCNTGAVARQTAVLTYLMQSLPLTVNGVNYVGLDNVPCVEGIILDEEYFATGNGQLGTAFTNLPGYSDAGWVNGIETAFAGLAAACIKTNAIAPYNWQTAPIGGNAAHTQAAISAIGQTIVNAVGAVGGPDVLPFQSNTITGAPNNPYVGTDGDVWYRGAITGSTNWIGKLPRMMEVQQPDYGTPPVPPSQLTALYQCVNTGNGSTIPGEQCTHVFWARVSSSDSSDWNSGVAPFLAANTLTNNAYPSLYPSQLGFSQVFNFPNFSGTPTGIHFNGTSTYSGGNILMLPLSSHSAGQAFWSTQLNIQQFETSFTFSFAAGLNVPVTCGMSLIIQAGAPNNNTGDANLSGYGWFTRVQQIQNSVGLKFDLNEGNNSQNSWVLGGAPSSIGLYINGGPSAGLMPADDVQSAGINFYSGHTFAANVVYDGVLLTLTLLDTTTNAQLRKSWPVNIPAACGQNTAFVGFGAGTVSAQGNPTIFAWSYSTGGGTSNPRLAAPVFSLAGGLYPSAQTVSLSGPAGATLYYTTNGSSPTASGTQYTAPFSVSASQFVQAVAIRPGFTDSLPAVANYVIGAGGTPTINFPSGFASSASLINRIGIATLNGANLQLCPGSSQNDIGCGWFVSPVSIGSFTANFTFTLSTAAGGSQGMCFVIQNQPPASSTPTGAVQGWVSGGVTAMGNDGPGLGYSGITSTVDGQIAGILSSVALKFDQFTTVGGATATGLYTNGADVSQNGVSTSPVNLAAGHTYNAALTYDGTTLTMVLKDNNTSQTVTKAFTVNIPSIVGGSTAYVGFTASTGGGAQGAVAITAFTGF